MSTIDTAPYSPLNKALAHVFDAYKTAGYVALFVFRDGWGELLYAATRPDIAPWEGFEKAAAAHEVKQPLIAFDLRGEFAEQMPQHLWGTLETLDIFAFAPLIHIATPSGIVPEAERKRVLDQMMKPALHAISGGAQERRSPPRGKLRLV